MLGMPQYGWSSVELGKFEGPASYLTNVPHDCLDAMIHHYKTGADFIVSFDAEGYTFKVISDGYQTYILEEQEEIPKIYVYEKDVDELADELIKNIETYFNEWVRWDYIEEEDDGTQLQKETNRLRRKLRTLKNLKT